MVLSNWNRDDGFAGGNNLGEVDQLMGLDALSRVRAAVRSFLLRVKLEAVEQVSKIALSIRSGREPLYNFGGANLSRSESALAAAAGGDVPCIG